MAEYLLELYVSRSDGAAVARGEERARIAAEELARTGTPISFVRSIFVPEDEIAFYLCEACSVDAVTKLAERAGLRFERVVETVRLETPTGHRDEQERLTPPPCVASAAAPAAAHRTRFSERETNENANRERGWTMGLLKRLGLIAVGTGIAAVTCGLAIAAGVTLPFTGTGNTIGGCYSTGGALKVRTPAEPTCPKGYTAIEWNVTGPQGAQGPQGPAGATGPQGPPGPAATISSFRTFKVEVSKDVGFFNFGSAFAECPAGSIRTGGGVFVTDGDIKASEPSGENGWKASASTGIFGGFVHAIAVCMTSS